MCFPCPDNFFAPCSIDIVFAEEKPITKTIKLRLREEKDGFYNNEKANYCRGYIKDGVVNIHTNSLHFLFW